MPRRALCSLVVGLLAACSACTGGSASTHRSADAPVVAPTSTSPGVAAAAAPDRPVTKLLVVVVENHSFDQMRTQMPYTAALAQEFGYATDFRGVEYPSLPNYVAITSGSTHGITDDGSPSAHPLDGPSVFGEAVAQGGTAAVYADGMPANCAAENGGSEYAVKHNPWVYYRAELELCRAGDVPATRLADAARNGDLPNAGMVVPNMCHDAHDCDLSVADDWIRAEMGVVFAGPDWASGHLAVVITADTDDRKNDNRILTVVVHPSQHGNVVGQRLDHYSLSRLYTDVVHAPALNRAASAASMSDAFGLPLG